LPQSCQARGQWSAPWRCGIPRGGLAQSADCLLRSGSWYSPHCVLAAGRFYALACVLVAILQYLPYKELTLAITIVRVTDSRPSFTYYTMDEPMSRAISELACREPEHSRRVPVCPPVRRVCLRQVQPRSQRRDVLPV